VGKTMEVRIIGSSTDAPRDRQNASSYLINGTVCIDAGCVGFWDSPEQQGAIRHLVLTHSHMDHIATLPILLENVFHPATEPIHLHATEPTLAVLRDHIFNNHVWPDFFSIRPFGRAFVTVSQVTPGQMFELEGLQILPVSVHHQVPTVGYIVCDGRSTVVFGSDSAPTEEIWRVAATFPEPRSVFIEASFPNSMTRLAELSMHLTPAMVGGECAKMPPMENVFIIHVKSRFREIIESELNALGIPGLRIAECNGIYTL
jgi:ribonuclease BN (tRNA processing enzyme)